MGRGLTGLECVHGVAAYRCERCRDQGERLEKALAARDERAVKVVRDEIQRDGMPVTMGFIVGYGEVGRERQRKLQGIMFANGFTFQGKGSLGKFMLALAEGEYVIGERRKYKLVPREEGDGEQKA